MLAKETVTLEGLYTRHGAQVFRHAYFLLGSRDDAEDILQETFLRAHKALGNFATRSSHQTWLLRICTNLCYDHQRQKLRHQSAESALPIPSLQPDPAELAAQSETTQRLLRVLDGLPLADRTVLVLHLLEGLDYSQLAQVLDCTRPGAKMRTLRALRRLRERVERTFTTEERS
ncbi:RNA polymerase sigma factor [Armatimonas sp.]|uniref:RNA polymerase sigma factor n=1 Tax=Armatimonas sp. TaxID=1872638 RepID=UPI00286D485E|nr:RNA polymerase sigma factor [Armatimonas sp.]